MLKTVKGYGGVVSGQIAGTKRAERDLLGWGRGMMKIVAMVMN